MIVRIRSYINRIKKKLCQASIKEYLENRDSDIVFPVLSDMAGNEWDAYMSDIMGELRSSPSSFLRQPTISKTVHPNELELALSYLVELSNDKFSREMILPRLHDVPMGDPHLCPFFPFASPVTVQHGFYLAKMQEYFDVFMPDSDIKNIVDIGGGYGNFCRIIFDYGFNGTYNIVDLPGMHVLQKHYLSLIYPKEIEDGKINFGLVSDDVMFASNEKSLLIATFSMSEMPVSTRELIKEKIRNFDYIFLAYNQSFDGVDNESYFKELSNYLCDSHDINMVKDTHRRAWFLFLEKRF